jgi:flagellar hook-associated protein 2
MNDINDFIGKYFDVLKPEHYILSNVNTKQAALYSSYSDTSRYVDVIVNSDAKEGDFQIDEITQLATASKTESESGIKGQVEGSTDLNEGPLSFQESKFKLTLDGVSKHIIVDGEFENGESLATYLNETFDSIFGEGRVNSSLNGDGQLTFSAMHSVIQVHSGEENNFLDHVGMTTGERNVADIYQLISQVFGEEEPISFSINDVSFEFDANIAIADIMKVVNRSEAGVVMSYNSLTDKIAINGTTTGASSSIKIENTTGQFFGTQSITNIETGTIRNGTDAKATINGLEVTRNTNVFSIDNVTYALKGLTTEPITYTISSDVESIMSKITHFVSDFNQLYGNLQEMTSEKVELDYKPLTDKQKEEMSESQIEKWEEKAKSGLLRNDNILTNIMNQMRNAFWDPVEGTGLTFNQIGIKTSNNYNKFELVIDETKLRTAIQQDAQEVMNLFHQTNGTSYNPSASGQAKSTRYQQSGLSTRISDILNDAVRTRRDANGFKGTLVERIGVAGDTTESNNFMKRQLDAMEKRIQSAISILTRREDQYWKQFTQMERVISQLNAQSEALYGMTMF